MAILGIESEIYLKIWVSAAFLFEKSSFELYSFTFGFLSAGLLNLLKERTIALRDITVQHTSIQMKCGWRYLI